MKKLLVTGATGNVGSELIRQLALDKHHLEVIAAVRNPQKVPSFINNAVDGLRVLDMTVESTFNSCLSGIDILFLVRPPQLSQAKKHFKPFMDAAEAAGVKHVVFLSVQGAAENSMIPHHMIEKIIEESSMTYTFLRPAYFMQNFLTTLKKDLVENSIIYLPAGTAKFSIIDVRDLAAVAAEVVKRPGEHSNRAYDLTNSELLSFEDMAQQLSEVLGRKIRHSSPSLLSFYLHKKKEGEPLAYILVMIMLHYLPRYSSPPGLSRFVEEITGKEARSFRQFAEEHRAAMISAETANFNS